MFFFRRSVHLEIPGFPHAVRMDVHSRPDQYISKEISERKIWEPFETSVFISLIRPGCVVLDIGANIGYYTLIAAKVAGPTGEVHAFEPDESNHGLLLANLRRNRISNATTYQAAVSNKDGQEFLYLNEANLGDHRLYETPGTPRRSVLVKSLSLDSLFPPNKRIDLIKIDAQGSEYKIFTGMREILRNRRASLNIISEFWPYGLQNAGSSYQELLSVFSTYGFETSLIVESTAQLVPISHEDLARMMATPVFSKDQGFVNLLLKTPSHTNSAGDTVSSANEPGT